MPSIREIVEAPSDWLDVLEPSRRWRIVRLRDSDSALPDKVDSALVASGVIQLQGASPETDGEAPAPPHVPIGTRFLDELHDLLCSDERYEAERANLLKEYKAGQSAFVGLASSIMGAQLGIAPGMLTGAIVLVLSVAGPVSLNVWCASQSERRARDAAQLKRLQVRYKKDLRAWQAREKAAAVAESAGP